MPKTPAVTLKDIANELGISSTAASMALRNRKGVSDELREQVAACAKRLGYEPNPITVELMTILRSKRPNNPDHQLIAYVNTFPDPALYLQSPNYREFDEGAKERARHYGYQLEIFNAYGQGMTPARLSQILKARGVRGVLVGPRYSNSPDLDMDWSAFSTVLVGAEKYGAGIYRVCNNHVHTSATTLHNLGKLGYARIGVVLVHTYEEKRGFDYLLGVEQFLHENTGKVKVEVSMIRDWKPDECVRWIKEKRLDAVVSLEPYVWEAVAACREKTGKPLGYACLSVLPDAPFSGINQHYAEIGAVSVELLRTLMMNGARGVVARPQVILIEGEWIEGSTAPKLV